MGTPPRPTVDIAAFHDPVTGSFSYVVADPAARRAAVIDPVLDYDPKAARTSTAGADALVAHLAKHALTLEWILETHAHADHLSAAAYLKAKAGGRTGIGRGITAVQSTMARLFHLGPEFRADGSQFDHLFADGERFAIGALEARVMATPGHTSDSVTYLVGDAAFIGDTLFPPDYGTARTDFPGGDAGQLYDSIQALYALAPGTRFFMCHDYPPADRAARHEIPLEEERATNIHVRDGTTREAFVALRRGRDAKLAAPVLILPAIQVNIRAGHLPAPEANGVSYLRIPVDALGAST
jgi:glyoxylase-like metal-dependent hydrolase (beta-lactamase superfamily II)